MQGQQLYLHISSILAPVGDKPIYMHKLESTLVKSDCLISEERGNCLKLFPNLSGCCMPGLVKYGS